MFDALCRKEKSIAVIGLGYVGLPVALAFARKFRVIGFDINADRVAMMQQGTDPSKELDKAAFEHADILFTADPEDLKNAHFFVVAVPTPIDMHKVPDLKPVFGASEYVGQALKPGDYVVYESTVYPGCTEEDCVPILQRLSGLRLGEDFKVGYSPERINPGDKEKTVENILKIVSGCDEESLEQVALVYGAIITAGIFKAKTIKVAEAAKVIENTQRDLNISLMNELSVIFDKMGIDTKAVIEAAATKWNFMKFYPGLVGGHCIGVDPYYLIHKALALGVDPQVIRSGRWINDQMPAFIAKKLVQMLIRKGKNPQNTKVLVLGLTFKENVADIRNSKVADLVKELMGFSIHVHVVDPYASPNEVAHEYGITIVDAPSSNYDAVVVAVNHTAFQTYGLDQFLALMNGEPVLFDLKGIYDRDEMEQKLTYWRL
ncbi:MAG: nucleotide sugar dehydrogenase [Saprospiraceae bacterium]|nr:nucleotide sugar dehydrogenase [Saprospiraceae bacterium]